MLRNIVVGSALPALAVLGQPTKKPEIGIQGAIYTTVDVSYKTNEYCGSLGEGITSLTVGWCKETYPTPDNVTEAYLYATLGEGANLWPDACPDIKAPAGDKAGCMPVDDIYYGPSASGLPGPRLFCQNVCYYYVYVYGLCMHTV